MGSRNQAFSVLNKVRISYFLIDALNYQKYRVYYLKAISHFSINAMYRVKFLFQVLIK